MIGVVCNGKVFAHGYGRLFGGELQKMVDESVKNPRFQQGEDALLSGV